MRAYLVGLGLTAILLTGSATFSALESAFFYLPKKDREEIGEGKDIVAARLRRFLAHPRRLRMAIRLAGLAVRVVAVAFGSLVALRFAPHVGVPGGLLLAIHAAVLFVLIAGPAEAIPRAYGISRARTVVVAGAPILGLLDRWVVPAVSLLAVPLRRTAARLGVWWAVPYPTAEDVIAIVAAGEEEGGIEEDEREMIDSIFELGETTVREVMVPRVDMVAVERKSPIREALGEITRSGHSRIPVYEERIDKIVGVVYAKDLLRPHRVSSVDIPVERVMREPFFVPEGKRVDDLLREFQKEKVHLAAVVDEYGGTAGLVTLEDVLEEIVGEIQDEYDREDELFEEVGSGAALVNAKIAIDDLNERFRINLPADRHDTLGGYLYELIDRVPAEGESFKDRESGLLFKVEGVDRQRIARVRIRKIEPPAEGAPEEGAEEGE